MFPQTIFDLDQGLTAVIQVDGGTLEQQNLLMLTTKRQVPFSIHQLVGMGVYPERQKIIVVKAAVAFRAAYEPVAGEIIEVDTKYGPVPVKLARLQQRVKLSAEYEDCRALALSAGVSLEEIERAALVAARRHLRDHDVLPDEA